MGDFNQPDVHFSNFGGPWRSSVISSWPKWLNSPCSIKQMLCWTSYSPARRGSLAMRRSRLWDGVIQDPEKGEQVWKQDHNLGFQESRLVLFRDFLGRVSWDKRTPWREEGPKKDYWSSRTISSKFKRGPFQWAESLEKILGSLHRWTKSWPNSSSKGTKRLVQSPC